MASNGDDEEERVTEPSVLSRRQFIGAAASAAAVGAMPVGLGALAAPARADSDPTATDMALPRDVRSLILYTVRNAFTGQASTAEMLDKIASHGFKGLEMAGNTGGFSNAAFRDEVVARGMYLVGDHSSPGSMRGGNRAATIARAAELELPRLGTGGFDNAANVDGYKAAAEEMNGFGQALQAQIPGCRWYCHLHSHEWALITDANNSGQPAYNGRRLIEIWFEELDPQYAFIEVDIAWAWRALGAQTPDYVATYQDAIEYFHVKDVSGTVPSSVDVDYGLGVVEFESIYNVLTDPAAHQFIAERDGSTNYVQTLTVYGQHLSSVRLDRSTIDAPAIVTAPAIAGSGRVGEELTAEPGSWARAAGATFSYRWLDAGGLPLAGATTQTYMPAEDELGDELSVEVKAATAEGKTVAESATVTVAPAADPDPDPDPPAPGPAAPGPPQLGRLSLGRLRRDRARGTAKLAVNVPGAGRLALEGKGVAGRSLDVAAAGEVMVPIKARGPALRRLRRSGRVAVSAELTYTPASGAAQTDAVQVKLVRDDSKR
jgi:sugar phosphate isomerase/epimerase